MADIKIKIDERALKELGHDVEVAEEVGLRRVLERGEQLLREEIPKVTHNLAQGVSSHVEPRTRKGMLEGALVISARRGRTGARTATIHEASGKTKTVSLKGQDTFDYAEAVAHGTGIYGPAGVAISPSKGKALLIPVSAPPTLNGKPQGYVDIGGQIFIVRKSMKGMRANPYDERAGTRLGNEAPAIFDRALADVRSGE
jgi:hypothetical protein